jgi:hypothetical protein
MRGYVRKIFLWSWVITVPISLVGSYLLYRAVDRTYTYSVRYGGEKRELQFDRIARYEASQLANFARVNLIKGLGRKQTSLKSLHLVIPEANLAQLESHMPQSGFEYVDGRIIRDGRLSKVKVKYRGDTFYRWAWDKKSLRIKTAKKSLFEGIRSINLLAPRVEEQLNNYLSYRLAEMMGVLVPRTEVVRLFLNGKDRGVHILVEQIKELTLRNASLMPGDIYRGEMVGKDRFGPGAPTGSLFKSATVWDKVAINNHFADSSKAPLEQLINLIQQSHLPGAQAQLSQIMDMKAWGRFSAFESLAQTTHTDEIHNWRIYFDPWRSQFVPIVWDPMGWHGMLRGVPMRDELISNSLIRVLFSNGDFIRARSEALYTFFATNTDQEFLELVSSTSEMMAREVLTDPYLKPANPVLVEKWVRKLEGMIRKVLGEKDDLFLENDSRQNLVVASTRLDHQSLDLIVRGKHPVERLRLNLSEAVTTPPSAITSYQLPTGEKEVSLPVVATNTGESLVIRGGFLPNLTVASEVRHRGTLQSSPGFFRIKLKGLNPNTKILSAEVNRGQGWIPAESVDSITPTVFSKLYAPVAVNTVPEPLTWSGEVTLEGHQILDQPLIIEPGTTVNLNPGATVVLKHRLTAIGTREAPIRFVPARSEQEPWGAVVLSGRGADGSTLSHCEMAGGSGLKGDLFEYSAMLSIHDVKDVVISDCQFRDNHVVDDMVHTVYTDIRFERVLFKNALSDALDLDISEAIISDSRFENSGNDAVDLMTTQASITGSYFNNNGDKGISVGENSQLYAVNNTLQGNLIGVQSKDRSTAVLLNQTFKDNKTGLHAYKKNWRYGEGGVIFLGKSTVSGGGTSASAEKRSVIQIFDSYLETPAKGKRVDTIAVEHQALRSALKQDFLPSPSEISPRLTNVLQDIPPELLRQASHAQRGNRIDG